MVLLMVLVAFFAWRFIRPMNIFVVADAFAVPVPVKTLPEPLTNLTAAECGQCHQDFYTEWSGAMHSQAWTDPYFQVDWAYDGSPQICKNCHIPLEPQQEHLVRGWRDDARWQPILEPNPEFDRDLQQEGVNCAGCHLREGKILAVHNYGESPHLIEKISSGNEICVRCHVVGGKRWDTFFSIPPCGTVTEIRKNTEGKPVETVNDLSVTDIAALGCVECHMPATMRPLSKDGPPRLVHRHLWRGGHDPQMVKKAVAVQAQANYEASSDQGMVSVTLTNVGALHHVPTGTPDRHLTVELKVQGKDHAIIAADKQVLKRNIMWRPFIADLSDNRLIFNKPREIELAFSGIAGQLPAIAEVIVRYHLLEEKRRLRIGYENKTPISYEIFRQRIPLGVADE